MDQQKKEDFYERVYEVVGQIPTGRVTTYGAIASYLGVASAARMVGYALNQTLRSENAPIIPAHRVVNRMGRLTGRKYFPDDTMKERLEQEGVRFIDEYQVDIDEHFWNPQELDEQSDI